MLVVYLSLAAAIVGAVGLAGVAAVNQVISASDTVSQEFEKQPGEKESSAERRVDRFQDWLDARGLGRVHVKDIGNRLVQNIQKQGVGDYAKRAVDIGQQVASEVVQGVIELLLITRDLDLPLTRRAAHLTRRRPRLPTGPRRHPARSAGPERTDPLCARPGDRLVPDRRELRGRRLHPLADRRLARRRPLRADPRPVGGMATEVIPYVGPILGALPAIALAAIHSPATALWVGSSTSASTSSRATSSSRA